jgi:hypothetical protein
MLFEPGRHEVLDCTPWRPTRVRDAIAAIVEDVVRNRADHGAWPVHPLDDEGDAPRTGFKGLYLGSAGVLWALSYLQSEGAAKLGTIDPIEGIRNADVAYRNDPDTGRRALRISWGTPASCCFAGRPPARGAWPTNSTTWSHPTSTIRRASRCGARPAR